MHTEDTNLGRIEDRGRHERAVDTTVGNGEGATLQFSQGQAPFASFPGQIGNFALEGRKTLLVSVTHHGHHEPLFDANSHTNIVVVLQHHLITLHLSIDHREGLEGTNHRSGEEGHEAQTHPVALFEAIFTPTA